MTDGSLKEDTVPDLDEPKSKHWPRASRKRIVGGPMSLCALDWREVKTFKHLSEALRAILRGILHCCEGNKYVEQKKEEKRHILC